MNYKDLEVWKKARELVLGIHCMTVEDLPKFEMYETGSQIRRSMKSVRANIVEGTEEDVINRIFYISSFMLNLQLMKQLIISKLFMKQAHLNRRKNTWTFMKNL